MNPSSTIRSRLIEERDLDEIATLLARGLGYPKEYFVRLFERLNDHRTPDDFPKYGFALANGGTIVGAIIMIFTEHPGSSATTIRCHVTSWYVEPEFRSYATLFFGHALKRNGVSYLNTSARPGTVAIIKAQGFSIYSKGQFVTFPFLRVFSKLHRGSVRWVADRTAELDPAEQKILSEHQKFGNLSFWCMDGGKAYPFVFQPRLFKGILPGAQLIYCRDIEDVVRFIGPIGRALLSRGIFFLRMDANGPMHGLVGLFFNGMEPRYYKGGRPRLGDLAYTQTVMLPFLRKSSAPLVQCKSGP